MLTCYCPQGIKVGLPLKLAKVIAFFGRGCFKSAISSGATNKSADSGTIAVAIQGHFDIVQVAVVTLVWTWELGSERAAEISTN